LAKAQPRKTWQYSEEFIREVVELTSERKHRISDVAQKLDLHPVMIYRWRKEYRDKGLLKHKGMKKSKTSKPSLKGQTRVKQLEKEVEMLKKENDLLKKWQRYLAETHQNDLDSSSDTEKS